MLGATRATDPAGEENPGDSLVGPYFLIEELGHGGAGVVYKARHLKLGRLVALKLLHGALMIPEAQLRRFELEGQILASLRHPNIVPIHEAGVDRGRRYLAMPLIEGETLDKAIFGLELPERVRMLVAVCHGAHYMHMRGVIHRDLKPSNVLVQQGTPLIVDFGLAKLVDPDLAQSERQLTQEGAVLGSPYYMSPEQPPARRRSSTCAATCSASA